MPLRTRESSMRMVANIGGRSRYVIGQCALAAIDPDLERNHRLRASPRAMGKLSGQASPRISDINVWSTHEENSRPFVHVAGRGLVRGDDRRNHQKGTHVTVNPSSSDPRPTSSRLRMTSTRTGRTPDSLSSAAFQRAIDSAVQRLIQPQPAQPMRRISMRQSVPAPQADTLVRRRCDPGYYCIDNQ